MTLDVCLTSDSSTLLPVYAPALVAVAVALQDYLVVISATDALCATAPSSDSGDVVNLQLHSDITTTPF